jgi:hypothetical protein
MKKTRIILEIETEVKNKFKAGCSLQGKSMKEVMTEFMKTYKPGNEKKGGDKKK